MTVRGSFTYREYGSEIGSLGLYFADIDAGGLNYDAVVASVVAVNADILAVSLCTQAGYQYVDGIGTDADTVPASEYAQRELGLRVFLSDDVNGRKSHFTVPGPDLAALTILAGTDLVDLADASVMADLVATVEANCLSVDDNAVSVIRAVIVGRRN